MQTLEKDPNLVCTQHSQKCAGLVSGEDIFQQMNICLSVYSDDWFARENVVALELCFSRASLGLLMLLPRSGKSASKYNTDLPQAASSL